MFNLLLALVYICFISLGLPDSLLGSAWPVMHQEIASPVSYAGIVSFVISMGTIVSSLVSDKMVRKFGTGKITAVSITMTAVALFGFSISSRFWMLILWSVPYGIGAGGVDAVLNNYVALHFKPQHMSWLHCMWGVGASISPYIMSFSLMKLDSWNYGYRIVSVIQIILSILIFISIPLWKNTQQLETEDSSQKIETKSLKFREIISLPGAISCFLTFFLYCGFELTIILWTSSYLVDNNGIAPEIASGLASLFYIGMTLGRFVNGFLAMKFGDKFLIRLGLGIMSAGMVLILIPDQSNLCLAGFALIGLGCAPVYPCIVHMTPDLFGRDKSQAVMGLQMASAYTGFLLMPALFGFIAEHISISLMPVYLLILLVPMIVMHEVVVSKSKIKK